VSAATGPCGQDDRYAAHLGIQAISADATTAQAAMTLGEQHLNDIGRAHGGALFSLADAAVALTANATPGERAVVTGSSIQFTRPAAHGDRLVATAVREFRLRRRAGYRVRITCEDDVVAVGSGETLVIPIEDPA
jgi:phenylacetic acid degradation protein PaaD